jgi:hypothetical protein
MPLFAITRYLKLWYEVGTPYCATAPHKATFTRPPQLKEYDEKVLVRIYRSILALGGALPLVVPGDDAGIDAPFTAPIQLPMAI